MCRKIFSESCFEFCKYQKKRSLNQQVYSLLVSGVSQRRSAKILKVNRKTIVRKFIFLGTLAFEVLNLQNLLFPKSNLVEFDDLETIEHTKCKPISVTLAVDQRTRRIMDFQVSRMPAKGLLAKISVAKYGRRKDERPQGRKRFFSQLKPLVEENAIFKSDDNPHYKADLKKHFPKAAHITYLSRKGSTTGQGELKKIGHDHVF